MTYKGNFFLNLSHAMMNARDARCYQELQWDPNVDYVFLGHVISLKSTQPIVHFPAKAFAHFHKAMLCAQRNIIIHKFHIQYSTTTVV